MIRQSLSPITLCALLCAASLGAGCISVQSASGGRVTYWVVPGLDTGERANQAGTTYYNQRWGSSPDTHPAVAGRPPALSESAGVPRASGTGGTGDAGSTADTTGTGPSAALRAADSGNAVENGSGSASTGYPSYPARSALEQRTDGQRTDGQRSDGQRSDGQRSDGPRTGAVIGALIGTQAGHRLTGVGAGAAIGALAGGKLADPCQPDVNAGSLWGALAGGWLGSLFGGGRGRELFTALGAAGGALRGTEQESRGRACR